VNSRKLIALFLVFALTGSALAAQQQRLYRGSADGDAEASGVTAVQQHSVFIEIVVEDEEEPDEVHKFAAVVGLIKKCKQVRNVFDNAVLWFNDQFLFGDKRNNVEENETEKGLGSQPDLTAEELNATAEEKGFVGESWNGTARWGGCYTPDGFAHAIGADDPFGTVNVEAGGADENVSAEDTQTGIFSADDNRDVVKNLIDLDQRCNGCIFEYDSSFFVVDPNGHEWIVDKYLYPLSVMGNLFSSGQGDDCGDSESNDTASPFTIDDPREGHDPNTCKDDTEDDRDNHRGGSESGFADPALYEPLFSVHLQTDTDTPDGLGFADQARFQYNATADDTQATAERNGAIYPGEDAQTREACETTITPDRRCSIEYNFLIAVDFAAFDGGGTSTGDGDPSVTQRGENEKTGCAVEHGEGGADNDTAYWQGNSHPHNPENRSASPNHCHSSVNLDIFFHSTAPKYTTDHQYWTDGAGTPVSWGPECNSEEDTETFSEGQDESAIDARTPLVCDDDSDAGEFHAHDGNQTISDDR